MYYSISKCIINTSRYYNLKSVRHSVKHLISVAVCKRLEVTLHFSDRHLDVLHDNDRDRFLAYIMSNNVTLYGEYTWAPETVHNMPVMNILKSYFCIYFSKRNTLKKPTWNFTFQLDLSMHVGGARQRKVRKTVNFQYSKSKQEHYSFKNWCELTVVKLNPQYSKTKS